MAGYVILGTLAAFGLLCGVWAAVCRIPPGLRGCVLVCMGQPDMEILTRYRLLRGLGLLNCPLLAVTGESGRNQDIDYCGREDLLSRLETERNRFDGTGNGDHTGNHQHGGIPEL